MNPAPLSATLLSIPLKAFFYLLYHQFSWSYDLVANIVSLGKWKSWVSAVLPYLEGDTILELGHGPGHLQSLLYSLGKSPVGLDQSKQMSRLAYKHLYQAVDQPRLINGYAQNIPFPTSTFDHIVATFPTDFIYQHETLREIWRVLRPGGSLIVLPVAIPFGRGTMDRITAGLFRITRQAPQSFDQETLDHIAAPFKSFGYDTTSEVISQSSSQLVILIARPVD